MLFVTKQNKQKRFCRLLLPTNINLQSGHTESQKDSHETLKSISYLKSSMEKLSVSPTLSESVFSCSFIIVIFVQMKILYCFSKPNTNE